MDEFTASEINYFILTKQHLVPESRIEDISKIAYDIGGLHATSQTTTYLSTFFRAINFRKEDLENEIYEKKNLGKIRCMRKTIFIQPTELIPRLYIATKKQYSKRHEDYLKNLGVSVEEYEKAAAEIRKIVAGKALSTADIKKEVNSKEYTTHFITLMCDQLDLIRNKPIKSWRDKRHTYSLFKEYFPEMSFEGINEEESMKFLVRKYLECLGPATETDIVWWSGFNKTQTRRILQELEGQIEKIQIKGINKEYLILSEDLKKLQTINKTDKSVVTLLSDLDPYLMGHKDRERYVKEEHYSYLFDKSGNATSAILLNGRVIGIWDFVSSKESSIKIFFLEKPDVSIKKQVLEEAKRVGKFIFDEETTITECKEMEPLKGRIPGEVLTPLKHC
ncbi:MAG: winged helix DNA-binding domain-containing protein [Candidatus Heimdallarchaeota archaeon]|nr:winged helix DNA-binding domain-containing protein [Candidatus Heimdallarchaeota archaeon]